MTDAAPRGIMIEKVKTPMGFGLAFSVPGIGRFVLVEDKFPRMNLTDAEWRVKVDMLRTILEIQ